MAIAAADIKKYLTGAAGDGGVQADPAASLGGFRSATEPTSDTDNNLFDDVSGAEASAGDVEYRCLCVKNGHGALELQNAVVWLADADIGVGNTVEIAVEVPATANLTNGAAQSVANESTVPASINAANHNGAGSGVSNWATPVTAGTGIALNLGGHDANLGVGEILFVWVKRTMGAGAAAANALKFTVRITGDTAA